MVNDGYFQVPLRYGTTDGVNLPCMPTGKNFCVGYNSRFGLIDVWKDRKNLLLEARVDIEGLLKGLKTADQATVDSKVEDHIMQAYTNWLDYKTSPQKPSTPPKPNLEVLVYDD